MTTLVEDIARQLCLADHDGVLVWDRMEEAQAVWLDEARRLLEFISQHPETLERRRRDYRAGFDHGYDFHDCMEAHELHPDCDPSIEQMFNDYLAAEKGEK